MSERRCDKCDYWEPHHKDSNEGQCRKSPPVIVDAINMTKWWPLTSGGAWCGEFKAAGEPLIVPPTPDGFDGLPY